MTFLSFWSYNDYIIGYRVSKEIDSYVCCGFLLFDAKMSKVKSLVQFMYDNDLEIQKPID